MTILIDRWDQTSARVERELDPAATQDEPAEGLVQYRGTNGVEPTSSSMVETSEEPDSTTDLWLDDDMIFLELAADSSTPMDVSKFVETYQAIDWSDKNGLEFVRAVELALKVGAHATARACVLKGIERFPDQPRLQYLARLLAPPRARAVSSPTNTSWSANRQWLAKNWDEYRGQWVALRHGALLGTSEDLDALLAEIGDTRGEEILVTSLK